MAVGVTLVRGTACARGRKENTRRSDLPIRTSGGGQAQKRREGESRDDLRHRRLLWLSGPLARCDDDHLIQRVIPLTLIGKTDDGLAIRAPLAPPDNASHGVTL